MASVDVLHFVLFLCLCFVHLLAHFVDVRIVLYAAFAVTCGRGDIKPQVNHLGYPLFFLFFALNGSVRAGAWCDGYKKRFAFFVSSTIFSLYRACDESSEGFSKFACDVTHHLLATRYQP